MTSLAREVLPSARRLIGSLRDIGYDLSAALADLVDNSLSAGATRIDVDMRFDGATSWIRVADDGSGMSRSQLDEALRFGTRREYASDELGRYGLGLKLATLSQCRLLTVASRATLGGRLHIAQWDLEHVENTDRWEILRPPARGMDSLVTEPLAENTGTVVCMDELDRVLRFAAPDGARAQHAFERTAHEVEAHLAMVFHRFIAGERADKRPVGIRFNGRSVAAWDPFCRSEPATLVIPSRTLLIAASGGSAAINIRPYILPNEAAFSSAGAHERAAGPRRWNRQQGLYIYRNDRMIQSGGWSRLRTADEHTKLARVAIDFPATLDGHFALNVAKSQARIPTSIRDELEQIVSGVAQLAQRAYRSNTAAGPHGGLATSRHAAPKDSRRETLLGLVDLVLDTCSSILTEELTDHSLALHRTVRELRGMRERFARELDDLIDPIRASSPEGNRAVTSR